MPETYLYRHRVTDDESDELRHANNVAYLEWMQEAAVAHSSASGWPPARYLELGFGWLVRRHVIEYLQPAFPGDQIVVKTWVASMDRVSCVRKYEITRDVDEVRLVNAWTDGRSASRTKEAAAEGDGRFLGRAAFTLGLCDNPGLRKKRFGLGYYVVGLSGLRPVKCPLGTAPVGPESPATSLTRRY